MPDVSEPKVKPEDAYLSPSSWAGDPVPDGSIGPWGLGQTCWYVRVTDDAGGDYRVFAAESPERATEAANAYLATRT